jgi:hypothetical protein
VVITITTIPAMAMNTTMGTTTNTGMTIIMNTGMGIITMIMTAARTTMAKARPALRFPA